jgi:serine/threonine-protein kinase
MRNDSSSDVAASEAEDERSVTAVADEPAVTRERAPEIEPGDVLAGRYQIEAILGKGGSGVVLRAFDRVSATVVAVKVLKAGLTHDPRWEKRFSRELRIGRPIRHANVCRIFDIGDADGYRFLTMEFATGGTLRDLIKKNQPLRPLSERLGDAAGVIAGLAAIHDAGIVHRDVKPDNMLRMEDGRLVLSDFGLATDLPDSTMVSVFVGTPHYMAPEVREGDPATTRSDVWSLGVVLHEIFFGKRPERRTSRSVTGVSKPSTTSSTLERAMRALCEKCLADDPAERPENATAVGRLFESARRSPGAILWSRARRRLSIGLLQESRSPRSVLSGSRRVWGRAIPSLRRRHLFRA